MTGILENFSVPESAVVELRELAGHTGAVTLGSEIREARERLQMGQRELADVVGVSVSTVSNWERGLSSPKNRLSLVREVLRMDKSTVDNGAETEADTDTDEDQLLAKISDTKFWLEAARRALRNANIDEGEANPKQPLRGRPGPVPEHFLNPQSSERRKYDRR